MSVKSKQNQYLLPNFDIDIPSNVVTKTQLREFISDNAGDNEYYCHSDLFKKVYYADKPGYLLSGLILEYKLSPLKYLYIEKDKHGFFTLVSIASGRVIYEGKVDNIAFCVSQINILLGYDEHPLEIESFNLSEDQLSLISGINGNGVEINLFELSQSIGASLKPIGMFKFKKIVTGHNVGFLKDKKKLSILLVIVVLILVFGYYFLSHHTSSNDDMAAKLRAMKMKMAKHHRVEADKTKLTAKPKKVVDMYKRYVDTMILADDIVKAYFKGFSQINSTYPELTTIHSITYQNNTITFGLAFKFVDSLLLSDVVSKAKEHHLSLVLDDQKNLAHASITFLVKQNKEQSSDLFKHKAEIDHNVIDYLTFIKKIDVKHKISYELSAVKSFQGYKTEDLTLSLKAVTLNEVASIIQSTQSFASKVISFTSTPLDNSNDLLWDIDINIEFFGV
ncbi:hypothetical protein [Cysteiniphilum halobium]|uniref:hypothetical protein n=1 Tax=Cysteiniphilum halobium TaxID=2219059 RepID=UPI003F852313